MGRWQGLRRWSDSPPAAAALAALLLSWVAWTGRTPPAEPPPLRPVTADPTSGFRTVPKDVLLAGRNVSGWREPQVRQLLEQWAKEIRQAPVGAALDPATRGRVPELNGLEVDVVATLERLRVAAPGERVPLAFREVPPAVRLSDLPAGPIYSGNPGKHAVAFAVNVAWGEAFLPDMLRTLERKGVRATFFLVGQWAERYPEAAMAIAAGGHEIASHGYSAVEFDRLSPAEAADQIERAAEAIRNATGREPTLFSPHKGTFSPDLLRVANEKGYETVLWSLDTVDWMKPGVDRMVYRILSGAHNGAVILMHPTDQTAAALEPMIEGLRRKGYRIVTLGTLLSPSPLARD